MLPRFNVPDTTYGIDDPQEAKPVYWCDRCWGEIYSWGDAKQDLSGVYCERCFDEIHTGDE